MKRRITLAFTTLFTLVLLVVVYEQFKGRVKTWYSENYIVRATKFPAGPQPDQVCLTWSGDPKTTQAVQWRTSTAVTDGAVQWRAAADSGDEIRETVAIQAVIADRLLENDPEIHRFTAHLEGLAPGTAYAYRAGSKIADTWSEWAEFTTAPESAASWSFMYLGDPQLGLDYWGELLHKAFAARPDAAFYAVAGDLINSGSYRDEWDNYFAGAAGIFDRRPTVPVLGNHDYGKDNRPQMYLDLFALPTNGPNQIPPECAYSFRYANALFIVLDSNLPPEDQAGWLEEQLAAEDRATWKFALYHHPAYSSSPNRDNPEVRELWGALFDKYHLDAALQGHDHAYLRTYPMKDGKRVATASDGTYYIVSVSGTKYYKQEPHDYAEVQFADTSTYQTIDISTNPDRLTYRAHDFDGNIKDEFVIEK